MVVFVHLSPRRITHFKTPENLGDGPKPLRCLWFSCGDAWEKLAASDMPDTYLKNSKYKYEAKIDETKLLVLKTVKQIADFTDKYSIIDKERPDLTSASIDWNKVRSETGKSGIYIPNADLKTARKKYLWYYSFDICSIAVWNGDAILSMEESKN